MNEEKILIRLKNEISRTKDAIEIESQFIFEIVKAKLSIKIFFKGSIRGKNMHKNRRFGRAKILRPLPCSSAVLHDISMLNDDVK